MLLLRLVNKRLKTGSHLLAGSANGPISNSQLLQRLRDAPESTTPAERIETLKEKQVRNDPQNARSVVLTRRRYDEPLTVYDLTVAVKSSRFDCVAAGSLSTRCICPNLVTSFQCCDLFLFLFFGGGAAISCFSAWRFFGAGRRKLRRFYDSFLSLNDFFWVKNGGIFCYSVSGLVLWRISGLHPALLFRPYCRCYLTRNLSTFFFLSLNRILSLGSATVQNVQLGTNRPRLASSLESACSRLVTLRHPIHFDESFRQISGFTVWPAQRGEECVSNGCQLDRPLRRLFFFVFFF